MADIQKFLNQSGVSTLWTRVAEEVKKVDDKVAKHTTDIAGHASRIAVAEGKIDALEKGAYDDTEVRNLISDNADAIGANTAAIATLNSDASVAGSVANTATAIAATKVAEIVAGADANFDTLKEIADWILNDTTGAADMANDIAALQGQLAGIDSTVVAKIASEISAALKVDGVDKYALATDLTSLATRVKTLEDAGYQNAGQVGSAIDAKIAALNLATTYEAKGAAATAEANAKAYADSLAPNYDAAGTAATKANEALTAAKSYTDTEMAKIQALTDAEIEAAIAAAEAQMQA